MYSFSIYFILFYFIFNFNSYLTNIFFLMKKKKSLKCIIYSNSQTLLYYAYMKIHENKIKHLL